MNAPLFAPTDPDWPYAWPRPRGLDDAAARVGWLRRCYRDYARVLATRIFYGVEEDEAWDAEIAVPAVCLASRLEWPVGLAVIATDAERRLADDAAHAHDQALRRALWPMVKTGRPGQALLDAAQRIDHEHGACFATEELVELVRDIAFAAHPTARKSTRGR